tara:strand:+ start:1852 stop:2166 length:315 start_codon:yes stop_codon:yes gene_type:complete
MIKKIIGIMQIQITKERLTIQNNIWKSSLVLFFMALVSVYSSFFMDKKIIKKHENKRFLQELKSSFVANKKRVNDLRNEIITRVQKEPFGFIEPNKKDVITLLK